MLEREAELEALEAAISAGSGRVLILEGAAGVGTSALLDVARAMATERGHQILHARGSELMRGVPFGVAVEIFAETLRAATPAQREEELFSGAGGLAASLFSPATAYRPAIATDPSLPMVHGLYWLLVNLSESAPCLVVVDDVHWADEPSRCFLVYLVERVEGLPVTVLVALRPEDAAIAGRPLDRLRASPTDRILQLEPLSRDGTTALIRTGFFDQADDEFCQAVFDASQGNPFIIQELARAADLDGAPPTAASAGYVRTLAPESIVRSVGSRISRLPPEAGQLAQAVAVLGGDAYLRHAAALARLDSPAAVIAADALTAAGVLASGEPLDFSHPIIGTTVYSSISPNRRATLHARVVQLLVGEDPHPERLAIHLMQSPAGGDPDVVERLIIAAERAVAIGAGDGGALSAAGPGGTAATGRAGSRPGRAREGGGGGRRTRRAGPPEPGRRATRDRRGTRHAHPRHRADAAGAEPPPAGDRCPPPGPRDARDRIRSAPARIPDHAPPGQPRLPARTHTGADRRSRSGAAAGRRIREADAAGRTVVRMAVGQPPVRRGEGGGPAGPLGYHAPRSGGPRRARLLRRRVGPHLGRRPRRGRRRARRRPGRGGTPRMGHVHRQRQPPAFSAPVAAGGGGRRRRRGPAGGRGRRAGVDGVPPRGEGGPRPGPPRAGRPARGGPAPQPHRLRRSVAQHRH